jgi:hypothetical protein
VVTVSVGFVASAGFASVFFDVLLLNMFLSLLLSSEIAFGARNQEPVLTNAKRKEAIGSTKLRILRRDTHGFGCRRTVLEQMGEGVGNAVSKKRR